MDPHEELTALPQNAKATAMISSDIAATKSAVLAEPKGKAPTYHAQLSNQTQEPEQQPSKPRLTALLNKRSNLESTLASLEFERSTLVADCKLPSGLDMPETWSEEEKTKSALETANGVIKEHIALLHRYNEIKDIGQGLMGLIADKRGVRVREVMEEFGMEEKD